MAVGLGALHLHRNRARTLAQNVRPGPSAGRSETAQPGAAQEVSPVQKIL